MKSVQAWCCSVLLCGGLAACGGENQTGHGERTEEVVADSVVGGNATADTTTSAQELGADAAADGQVAVANITSASGSNLSGTATFTEENGAVKVVLTVQNATPGVHAVHIHENGDCSAPDATSAGGHWNPTNEPHGKRGTDQFHRGDMPNMTVGQDGTGRAELTVDNWVIGGTDSTRNLINKAVIVHAQPDDYTSQPSGSAGTRVGCGVITMKSM